MNLPLQGLRVIDLTRNVAGPYASLILADLGADVIKVEHPLGGDDTRTWGPPFWEGESAVFLALNRDKRSITLDLKQPEARVILERAVRISDVLVESFRPGALETLGFGYEWASSINDRIIYCSLTSYGDVGPMRDMPGYDPIMQAASGIMSVTGEPDRPPVRAGVSIVDMGTGMWAANSVLAALFSRVQTGRGARVGASLYESAIAWMSLLIPGYWATGTPPARHGSGASMLAPYEAFATKDGFLLLACGNDRLFRVLAQQLSHPEWPQDERFAHNPDRVRNRHALHETVEAATRQWKMEELAAKLRAAGVPCSSIRDAAGVAADEQALALGIFQAKPHPLIPNWQSVGMPFTLDGQRPPVKLPPPAKGQHNGEVLAELGFSAQEVERLVASSAMRGLDSTTE